jgi:hypothetical protein
MWTFASRRTTALVALSTAIVLATSVAVAATGAFAQPATGSITGRVVWGPCVRGIPLPMTPEGQGQTQPAAPNSSDAQPVPVRPVPVPATGLPAGAVLVAVQGTSISTRTDETGRFTLSGAPAGQFLMVAAGPVADSNVAIAARPNVTVGGGQTTDLGTLALGGASPLGVACRAVPGVAVPDAAPGAPGSEAPGSEAPGDMPPPASP